MSVCHSQHCFTFTEFDVCEIVFSAIWNLMGLNILNMTKKINLMFYCIDMHKFIYIYACINIYCKHPTIASMSGYLAHYIFDRNIQQFCSDAFSMLIVKESQCPQISS